MSYRGSPFRSKILVEKPSCLTILSGAGRVKAKRGIIIIAEITAKITPIKASLASLATRLLLATSGLRKVIRLRRRYSLLHLAMYFYCNKITKMLQVGFLFSNLDVDSC